MSKLILKGGRIIDPAKKVDKKADLLVENGLVKQIAGNINSKADKIIDASSMVICPGLIDSHVHLREPGYEEKETIKSGSKAAIAGGVTSLLCMPNTKPVIDDPAIIDFIKERQKAVGLAEIYPVAALTKGSLGNELSEMQLLADAGAVAFSDDGNNVDNGQVMRRTLEYLKLVNKPVLVHAEDGSLANGGQMNESLMSTRLGLKGSPKVAEEIIIFRDIELARLTGTRVHFMHISTANSVELIKEAKKEKLPITCEVTPHHLLLDDNMLENYDSNYKVKPPLRNSEDIKALLKGLKEGIIDCIASDHAPHALQDKEVEFEYAAFGISGIETMFNLALTHFEKELGLSKLIEKLTINPANIFNLEAETLAEGKPADILLFNPKGEVKVDSSEFFSKGRNTPFNGISLNGRIEMVIKNGKIVFGEGKIKLLSKKV